MTVGRSPECSVVIWDVPTGEAIAVGRTRGASSMVAWISSSEHPEFVTVGAEEVLLWTLEATHLCQRPLVLPSEAMESDCSCVCCDNLGRIFVGSSNGAVWALTVREIIKFWDLLALEYKA